MENTSTRSVAFVIKGYSDGCSGNFYGVFSEITQAFNSAIKYRNDHMSITKYDLTNGEELESYSWGWKHPPDLQKCIRTLTTPKKFSQETAEIIIEGTCKIILEDPSLRYGQALFNTIYEHSPEVANWHRGGQTDMFYTLDEGVAYEMFYDNYVEV